MTISTMAHGDRTERLNLRLSPDEFEVISELAEQTGLSASDVVRQALRMAYPEKFKAPAKPKRRKR